MRQAISAAIGLIMLLLAGGCASKGNYRAVWVNEKKGAPSDVRLDGKLCHLLTLTLTSEYYILGYDCGVNVSYPVVNMEGKINRYEEPHPKKIKIN